ncbi:MAG TPA: shikimate kinase [Verrucomicrobiota bacterium]|nr:shikimate kinase [Verrucomicrobiota bacterium]
MNADRTIRNLALIGFMGTGKSTVGHAAAYQLGFDFVDTDRLIETRAGKSVADIFAQEGEEVFRELERQVVENLAQCDRTVIATGGGLGANLDHLASLKRHALVVCLWTTADVIWERVRHHSHRPLLQVPNPRAHIRELLARREPFYRQADVLVNTGPRQLRDVIRHVLREFASARRSARRR